ncbi:MAG: HAMP domain-containing sensor histidine kinase [Candidatus Obscuribacter sp.]|nr:HAMP domain-containing sensor histidine kinase [Candidatus Obscuribacter sp.]
MVVSLVGPLALSVFIIAAVVATGWLFAIPQLTTVVNGRVPMAPTTALGFLLYAGYLAYWYYLARGRSLRRLRLVLGAFLMIGSLSLLLPYVYNGPDLENLLYAGRLPSSLVPYPGRMSPLTAFMFFNLGLVLSTLLLRLRDFYVAQFLLLINIAMSLVFLVGYLLAEPGLYSPGPYTSIANLTVFCFLLISFATLCAYPRQTVSSVFAGSSLGGFVARRLLPLCLLIAILGGSICVLGVRCGLWNWKLGTAFQAVFEASIFALLVFAIALSINKNERNRELSIAQHEKLAGQRDNFMAVLTHDLKNPLIGSDHVLSALLMGQLGPLTDGQKQLIWFLKQGNHELLIKVKNLLALYKYDRENPAFDLCRTDVANLVREAVDGVKEQASLRKVELVPELGSDLPQVSVDITAMVQVLTHLLRNAVRLSGPGQKVTIEACLEPPLNVAGSCLVAIVVRDQGPGLTEPDWERFCESSSRTSLPCDGQEPSDSGLGTYLSHRIVQAMGGKLSCESKPGAGCAFKIELPAVSEPVSHDLRGFA